jgi:response regulator NasT
MPEEKYVIAAADNPSQIAIRNILNPIGYIFLGYCSDAISLLRLVRSYHPDFVVVDSGIKISDIRNTLETMDDELLCPCIIIGDIRDNNLTDLVENSKSVSICPRHMLRELLVHTVEMANISYKRVSQLNMKLKEMTDNYETRKTVERAKWVLMNRDGMTEKDAYDRIRKKSMDNRMSMKDIAEAIVTAYDLLK